MPNLLSTQQIPMPVTHGAFSLVTGAGGDPLTEERSVASIVDGGVGFFSAATDHTATVRLEFWDAEPENPDEDAVVGTVNLAAPAVALVGIDTGISQEVPVPFTGLAEVRVSCAGRDEAARLAFEEHELFFDDVEQWLVQIWPGASEQRRT